jgi:sodium-dependent dicarboxylate transporter 2/3/5
MRKPAQRRKKAPVARDTECASCNRIEWIAYTTPRRLHQFLYSRRNFFLALLMAVVAYFGTTGQSELVRRTLATFAFGAGCWALEVFPLPITGLMIPVVLTLFGVVTPQDAFAPFSNSIIFLMIGGLVLGQSIRKHGLDRWIGYNLLTYSKGSIDRLVLLVMATAAFLSWWMSNTVAIAVILPVILSIMNAMPGMLVNLRMKLLLGISISASIGGMAMLTGSTPAMIAAALLGSIVPFGFLQWAYFGLPASLLALVVAFLILKRMYPSPKLTLNLDAIVEQKRQGDRLTSAQKKVMLVFAGTVVLWFLGSPIEVWLGLPSSVSSAAIVSILAVLTMFGFNLLDLKDLQQIQWELIFLVGGGILLGEAMIVSGAAGIMSGGIASLHSSVPTILLLLVLSLISLTLTNFISNSATAAILIPIAIDAAHVLGMNPVPFVMTVALSATIAFITPVGVPSTALVYATGHIAKDKLIKTGILIAIPTLLIALAAVWLLPVP